MMYQIFGKFELQFWITNIVWFAFWKDSMYGYGISTKSSVCSMFESFRKFDIWNFQVWKCKSDFFSRYLPTNYLYITLNQQLNWPNCNYLMRIWFKGLIISIDFFSLSFISIGGWDNPSRDRIFGQFFALFILRTIIFASVHLSLSL